MEDVILITKPISKQELKEIAVKRFGDLVKAVVDLEKGTMALGADLHSDEEAFLLNNGSDQQNLWGINLYPDLEMPEMVEFDSVINIRPKQNNRSRSVENEEIREKILAVVKNFII
ncbi:MAG: DUF5674 family protein [Patescibacteria group bacterium]|nr:DUF5674 family protein [Patescibacteria group bacterium]MDD5164291.1 DUF5674 family protein [Patescibacteria group bacterium]MDD5535028.1 DUF5674 family protein [Patescibacteria group bacterium]